MNKYLALQKDVLDINKVTVIGSPTITSDGVASGFSKDNYITKTFTSLFNNNYNFEIDSKINYQVSETNPNQVLWYFFWIFQCRIGSGKLHFLMPYGSNYVRSQAVLADYGINTGDDLYVKCISENASSRKLMFSKDGVNWNTITNTATTDKDLSTYTTCRLGQDPDGAILHGSIDLKQFKIYVDGQLVFQPVKPTYLLERRNENYYMLRR